MRLSELKNKEVIDIDSGMRLGRIGECEVSIDLTSGRLIDIMVPTEDGFSLFGKSRIELVAWERIHKIGNEFILLSANGDMNR